MNWPLTLFRTFSVVVVTLFTVAGTYRLFEVGPEGDPRDWSSFLTAGQMVATGTEGDLYNAHRFPPGFQFVYPPPMAVLYAPLGLLSEHAAYCAWIGFIWILYVLSILFILRALKPPPALGATIALGALASGAWWANSVVGQNGSLWLFSVASALYLHTQGKRGWSGVALSLLLLKPSIGIGVLFLFLLSRRWEVARGMLIGAFGFLTISLVLPLTLWSEWFLQIVSQLSKAGMVHEKFWFQDTLLAFFRSTFGERAMIFWGVTLACTAGLVVRAIGTHQSPISFERIISIAILGIISCSPYSFTYDSVLLVIPAALWLCNLRETLPPTTNLLVGSILWVITIQHVVGPFYLKTQSIPTVGLLVWLWLISITTMPTRTD